MYNKGEERGISVPSYYNEIHGLNPVFYVLQQRIGIYITLIKDTAMKRLVCSEEVTKAGHTHSDHSDIRNAKLEFHIQNLS